MQSTCPSCHKSIEHEDFLFEVECSCGMRFNPFFEPQSGGDAAAPSEAAASVEAAAPEADFQESTNAFKEIVAFGEELPGGNSPSPTPMATAAQETAPSPTVRPKTTPNLARTASDLASYLVTPGDQVTGFKVQSYFAPLSIWIAVESNSGNPVGQAFEELWRQAENLGANAITGFHWALSSDNSRILVAGIPVKCVPQNDN